MSGALTTLSAFSQPSGGGGGSPSFISEANRGGSTGDTAITFTVGATFATGTRAVIMVFTESYAAISGITDSGSNTWSLDKTGTTHTHYYVYSATISSALTSGVSTITIPTDGQYGRTYYGLFNITGGFGGVDISVETNSYSTSVSASGTTTVSNTTILGFVGLAGSVTYTGGGTFTTSTVHATGLENIYYIHKDNTSAASYNPAGTVSAAESWECVWIAYK